MCYANFVISFLLSGRHFLMSWLQLASAVIFGAQENKVCYCFFCFYICLPWRDGTICHDFSFWNVEFFFFWMLSFKPTFSLSSFHLHQVVLQFLSLSATRVVSSAYLRLLIFLPEILIPACALSNLIFLMMYSA